LHETQTLPSSSPADPLFIPSSASILADQPHSPFISPLQSSSSIPGWCLTITHHHPISSLIIPYHLSLPPLISHRMLPTHLSSNSMMLSVNFSDQLWLFVVVRDWL
jgi:hypothetical protein